MSVRSLSLALVASLVTVASVSCTPSAEDEIVRVGRQNNSGTYHYFRKTVLGEDLEYKQGTIDQSGSKDVVELVSGTPNAIGYSGMGYDTEEVKMLAVSEKPGGEAVAPTVESARAGEYPISRPLYIYTLGEPKGAVKAYLDWILSPEGQAIVEEIGYVPVEATGSADSPVPEGEQVIKVTGSDTMVNLAQAWAENYGKKHPEVSVQVAGGGSGVGISALIKGTTDMANTSRAMQPTELAGAKQRQGVEPVQHVVGRDALAVFVHQENPLDSISIEELAGIYGEGGTITRWSQVSGWPESSDGE